jgi:hypothetical protein
MLRQTLKQERQGTDRCQNQNQINLQIAPPKKSRSQTKILNVQKNFIAGPFNGNQCALLERSSPMQRSRAAMSEKRTYSMKAIGSLLWPLFGFQFCGRSTRIQAWNEAGLPSADIN